ncbi:hypothetical protein [Desemzia incerta]|uniref:hypothetical protein n=1 Tax=Desemzia incerta TaxID=82801 RepID=UPI0016607AF8|nr:hypothetical protein [Desemzia incerta]
MKKYIGILAIALTLFGCSRENSEETPAEQESSMVISSESIEESSESESVDENKAAYDLENGKETAEFFKEYFGLEGEIDAYEFEEEQEMNYMYPEIFNVTADATSDKVTQITFFDVNEEDIRNLLKTVGFPEDPIVEEALSFEGDLNEPIYGDIYTTKYYDEVEMGANITIKGSGWYAEEDNPYVLGIVYDKSIYDK